MARASSIVAATALLIAIASSGVGCSILLDTKGLAGDAQEPPSDASRVGDADDGSAPAADADANSPNETSYRAVVLADSPLVYWRMGSKAGVGVVADETGRGNDLLIEGSGAELDVTGALTTADSSDNTAIRFTGMSSAAATNPRAFDFVGRAPFTIEYWMKREPRPNGPTYEYVVGSSTGSGQNRFGYVIYVKSVDPAEAVFAWMSSAGSTDAQGVGAPPQTTFAHHAAVFDGSSVHFYVDGNDSTNTVPPGDELSPRTTKFTIAGDHDNDGFFSGVLDEIAVYDRALSPPQLAAHRTAALSPPRK